MPKPKSYTTTGDPQDIGSLEADELSVGGIDILTKLQDLQNQLDSLSSRVSALE